MSEPRITQEALLEIMRQELQQPTLSLEQAMENPLAKTLFEMVSRGSATAQQATNPKRTIDTRSGSLASLAASRAVITAATEDTFDIAKLDLDEAERTALLSASDIVMINGDRRLRLTDAARAELIAAVSDSEPYQTILRSAVLQDMMQHEAIGADPVRLPSAWLRCFLSGEFSHLDTAPPKELKAALAARERLRLVRNLPPGVPSVADLARRVGLAELLEPLRLLIGEEGGWDGTPRRDRFVGREPELKQLRAFVDELSSRSVTEFVDRFSAKAKSAITGDEKPGLVVIEARGGLGKSALLAKFVIDHALEQSRRFPFAYLDFDRATLDPERPHQLLIEITRQIGLQFPDAQPPLDRLAEDIRAELVRPSVDAETSTLRDIQDPFARFVEILRKHATFGRRAFLLVFDTLEVVQWSQSAMEKLAGFVQELRLKGLDELRVVASGRADVPELRRAHGSGVPTRHIKLKPLSIKEARDMAEVLGRGTIGSRWNSSWSEAVARPVRKEGAWFSTLFGAGTTATPDDVRREPLAVRVAVDMILQAPASERQDIADEIARSGVDGKGDFIARLYEKRIVNHVRDPRAQKLAWPGLVVRRVTSEIARELLAPVCGIRPEEAELAFAALGQEIWMVAREGDALRHRPDLRARTLPLMRAKNPETFDKVAHEAVVYFERYRERSREDHAEWLYHRLLLGENPREVERDITPDVLPMLARAEEDFPPTSAAASYIASRTSRTRLSPRRVRNLRPDDALYHLSVTSAEAFALDDMALDAIALDVSDRIGGVMTAISKDQHAWARALWVKTGAWRRMPKTLELGEELVSPLLRAHAFWAARIAPTLGARERLKLLDQCVQAVTMPWSQEERVDFRTVVQAMVLARIGGSQAFARIDAQVVRMLSTMKPNPVPSIQAALRTAIVFGESSRGSALNLWLKSRRRGSSERVRNSTVSLAELRALIRLQPDAAELLSGIDREELDGPTRFADDGTVATTGRVLEQVLGDLADRSGGEHHGNALARVFACRDEDWIVPFGYAATRATEGRFSPTLSQRLAGYAARSMNSDKTPPHAERPSDMLAAMRLADEAGDLAGYSRLVLAECDKNAPATAELNSLVSCRDAWSRSIVDVIGTDATASADGPLRSPFERPPAAWPIINRDDPQKGRWGGQNKRDGRAVRAVLESVERDLFYFSLIVESTDNSVLEPPVTFHLHDSYPRNVVSIRRIIDGRQAVLSEWSAYGVFTIGVQVKTAIGTWTSLELDLTALPGLPKRFRKH